MLVLFDLVMFFSLLFSILSFPTNFLIFLKDFIYLFEGGQDITSGGREGEADSLLSGEPDSGSIPGP